MLDRLSPEPPREPAARQPVFNIPAVVAWTIGALVAVHGIRLALPDRVDDQILARLAFVPGRLTFAWDGAAVAAHLVGLASSDADGLRQAQVERFFLGDGTAQPWTMVTYALLHADWAHLGLNSVWLLAFGAPVARRLGAASFLSFLGVASIGGAIAHYATHLPDLQPVIGASAAVSGCMGASLRFVFQPRASLSTILARGTNEETPPVVPPLLPLARVFRDRRALAFLVVWFATNLLFGLGAITLAGAGAAIAWQAHIGGFLVGLVLLPLFQARAAESPAPPPTDPGAPERD